MKIIKSLDEHFEEYLMGSLLIGISCVMLLQIFMRLIGESLVWAEELCRYFYLWSVFLSISFTIKKGIILRVDLLFHNLPRTIQKIVEITLQLINIVFFSFMSYYSILTVRGIRMSTQSSPAMEIPMFLVYLIIPLGFILTTIRCAQQIYLISTGESSIEKEDFLQTQ